MKQSYFSLFILAAIFTYAQKATKKVQQQAVASETQNVEFTRTCGTQMPDDAWEAAFQKEIAKYIADVSSGKKTALARTIPVVVHVIHNNNPVGSGDNISNAQIVSQISVLNNDFAGTGLGSGAIPNAFSSAKANAQINFCLASIDKNGATMAEPGVDRINYSSLGLGAYPSQFGTNFINTSVKPATIWDPTRYLNIWVFNSIESLTPGSTTLGYATFPPGTSLSGIPSSLTGSSTTDGLAIWNQAFGTVGQLSSSTNKGRTATHEIGHYLGLRHIWGDPTSGCASDFCNDTPPAEDANQGCPSFPHKPNNTCGSNGNGEMFMNFMDYTLDNCMSLFTNDQNTRMQTALANSSLRSVLGTHGLCTAVNSPVNCDTLANFIPSNSNLDSSRSAGWGWIAGHNNYKDKSKAEEFNFTAGTKKLVGALMILDHAYDVSGSGSLVMAYWTANGNKPSTSATAAVSFALAPIPEDAFVYFGFSSPVTVSGSKFFVGIDNLIYPPTSSSQDSIALFTAKASTLNNNTAWEKQADNKWYPFTNVDTSWNRKAAFTIFPIFQCPSIVGTEEILNPTNQTLFYPNPTSNQLLISLAGDNKSIKAKTIVRDAFGKTIRIDNFNTETNKTISLATSDLSDGIYFIELVTDKKTEVKKVIIKH
jgi:Pregnancy-associated plasma protein-A/Secretion system C-terminal sorting domain